MSDDNKKPAVKKAAAKKAAAPEPKGDDKPVAAQPVEEVVTEVAPVLNVETPDLGTLVYYVTSRGTLRPAVVTAITDGLVDLTVFNSQGAIPVIEVQAEASGKIPHTWHRPD